MNYKYSILLHLKARTLYLIAGESGRPLWQLGSQLVRHLRHPLGRGLHHGGHTGKFTSLYCTSGTTIVSSLHFLQMMRQMSNSVRHSSSFARTVCKFFSNPFYDFR